MPHFHGVGVLGKKRGIARPNVARVGVIQKGVDLSASRAVHPAAVTGNPCIFVVALARNVQRWIHREVVVLERGIGRRRNLGQREYLLESHASRNAPNSPLASPRSVCRMDAFAVGEIVLFLPGIPRNEEPFSVCQAIGGDVLEGIFREGDIGFPAPFEAPFVGQGFFEVNRENGAPAPVFLFVDVGDLQGRVEVERVFGHVFFAEPTRVGLSPSDPEVVVPVAVEFLAVAQVGIPAVSALGFFCEPQGGDFQAGVPEFFVEQGVAVEVVVEVAVEREGKRDVFSDKPIPPNPHRASAADIEPRAGLGQVRGVIKEAREPGGIGFRPRIALIPTQGPVEICLL